MSALLTTVPVLLSLLGTLAADEPGRPPRSLAALTSFDGLQKRLGDPGLRLLDARPRADFEKGHVPGAVWVDTKAAEALAARPGGLDDRAAWEAWVAPLGVTPGTEVLVYDARRQLDAARLWWLLGYLGVEKVGLVDGNFPLWQREGRPVTAVVRTVPPAPFHVAFRKDRLATRSDVLAALKSRSSQVVDARSAPEYTGAEARSRRGGHVPGACPLEWTNLVDRDGRFLDEKTLRSKLEASGVKPGEPVITHCQSGGRASVDAFVFERLVFPTRNYYPGWSDWGNADETPVEAGERPG
jgi:thiosulfate/3-mercaptopyruvate sulfurtransferase